MPAELPQELADRAERYLRQFDRGICTLDELENELLGAAHNYADSEYERANPGWAKEAIFDQAAWETGFDGQQDLVDQVDRNAAVTMPAEPGHALIVQAIAQREGYLSARRGSPRRNPFQLPKDP